MSEQETLRLVMEAVDKYSPEMKKFVNTLKGISEAGKKAHDEGSKQATEHGRAYKLLAEQISGLKTKGIDVARPALAEMGIAVGSVAGAVAAMGVVLVKSTKDWAEFGQQLVFAHRASGLHTDTLRGLAEANVEYGASQEETIKGLEEFGQHMDQQHRRSYAWLNGYKQFPTLWNQIGKSLDGLGREQQLDKVMKFVPTINDSDQRARVLAFFGLPANWRDLTAAEMSDMERSSKEFSKNFAFDAEKAKKANHVWAEFAMTMRGIYGTVGNIAGSTIFDSAKLVADSKTFAAIKDDVDIIGKDFAFVGDGAKAIGGYLKDWGFSALRVQADGIRSAFDAIRAAAEFIKQLSAPAKPHTDDNKWLPWGKPVFGDDKKNQESVKKGVKEGLEEFYHTLRDANGAYTPMAYHPPGSPGGGGMFGSKEYPALSDEQAKAYGGGTGGGGAGLGGQTPKSMGRAPDGSNTPLDAGGAPTGGGGSGINRDKWLQQLNANPALKESLYRHSLGENTNPMANQAVMEEAANRAYIRGNKRFDEHGNLSYFQGYHSGPISAKQRMMLDENFRKVFVEGSDISKGAIDNSSQWLSAKHERNGRFKTTANFGGDGITGHRGVESFEIPGWGESGRGERDRWPAWRRAQLKEAGERLRAAHGANIKDMATRGRPPSDATLLKRGMRGTDASDTLNSNAHLTVDLNGFPKGTRTGMKNDGFKPVTLNRGRPMAPASETS